MSWAIKPIYGGAVYGLNVYGQYREVDLQLAENLIESDAIIVKIREKNGFLKMAYHSNTSAGFPFSRLKMSWIGKSPSELDFDLIEHPKDRRFEVFYGDIIEVYIYSDAVPYWSGIITQKPEGISENKSYSYKASGLKKRIEATVINTKTTSSKNISAWITEIVSGLGGTDLLDQVPQLIYNSAKIESISTSVNNMDFTNKKASDALNKLQEIAGNMEWGVDAQREFYFYEKPTTVDNRHIYFAGIHTPDIEVTETDVSKIENKYFAEKKASSGAGTSFLNTYNQASSQARFGIYAKTLQFPEGSGTTEAAAYCTNMLQIKAYPALKGSVKNIPFFKNANEWTNKYLIGGGIARVFTPEQYNLETIQALESLTPVYTNSTAHFAVSLTNNIVVQGDYSLKIDATTSATSKYVEITLAEPQDWETAQEISFWIRASRAGTNLKFGFGSTSYTANLFDVYINSVNTWEKITIDTTSTELTGIDSITKIGLKCVDAASANTIYLDNIQKYNYGRKSYDLENVKAELILEPGKSVYNLEFESLDWPFTADFAEAWRAIEALKQVTKGV